MARRVLFQGLCRPSSRAASSPMDPFKFPVSYNSICSIDPPLLNSANCILVLIAQDFWTLHPEKDVAKHHREKNAIQYQRPWDANLDIDACFLICAMTTWDHWDSLQLREKDKNLLFLVRPGKMITISSVAYSVSKRDDWWFRVLSWSFLYWWQQASAAYFVNHLIKSVDSK